MRCVTLTNSRAQVAMSEGYECNALPEAELARFLAKRPQTLGDTSRVGSGAPGQPNTVPQHTRLVCRGIVRVPPP